MSMYPHQLSGGMCQRVLLAITFGKQPRLLIADKPTASLDDNNKELVLDSLLSLKKKCNTAIILITHEKKLAQRLSDRIYYLNGGRMVNE